MTLQSVAKVIRNDTTDLSALERTTIAKVLQESRGNKTKAARCVAPRALPVNSSFENYTAFTPAPSREAEVNRMIATS